ncbi:MAG: hypothetical protein Q9195_007853 [Heterodermia aff. obscurata]
MGDATSRKNPLKWEGNFITRAPVWPREPDLTVIKRLAMEHLASELPHAFNGAETKISDFAYGAFNKLYLVSYDGHDVSYLFRATLPVVPFYKTESEVATLAYLRAKTSIPVPRAIAWNSSADNDLGFEWILMDKVAGVELRSVWRRMLWQRKLELVDKLAGFIHQLRAHTFSSIGSLYFKSALESHQSGRSHESMDAFFEDPPMEDGLADISTELQGERNAITIHSTLQKEDIETQSAHEGPEDEHENGSSAFELQGDDEFVIGPVFSWIFWKNSRLYLPGNRGPYQSCSEWYQALIEMQITWTKSCREEDDSDYDTDFEEKEAPELLAWCQQYLDILPVICPKQEDYSPSSLHHHDLNEANILVDPETFEITGIVDWETINCLPDWRATDYPEFIKSCDPPWDTEPPIPNYDEGETLDTDMRDQWDNRILRGRFDEAMKQLSATYESTMASKSRETKRKFENKIGDITDWPKRAQNWLRRYKAAIDLERKTEEKKIEEKRENIDEDEARTGNELTKEVTSAKQNGSDIVAHAEPKTDTTAQTAKQATPMAIVTEPKFVIGFVSANDKPSDQPTKDETLSPASDTTVSSWSSTSLEDSVHEVALGPRDFNGPNAAEKGSIGSISGTMYPEESRMQLYEIIAKTEAQEATSSNVSEAGTGYTAPTEKTTEMNEELTTSSNISEAGTDNTDPAEKMAHLDEELPTSSNLS